MGRGQGGGRSKQVEGQEPGKAHMQRKHPGLLCLKVAAHGSLDSSGKGHEDHTEELGLRPIGSGEH